MAALKEAAAAGDAGDVAGARDADHAVADDEVVPPACRRLGRARRWRRQTCPICCRRRFGRDAGAPALFRNPDRHRRPGHQLASALRRMAQAAPSARRVHLRAGHSSAASRTHSAPTMLNPDLAAVVINEGFALRSRHDAPVLRTLTASIELSSEVRRLRACGSRTFSSACGPSSISI